jgi:hypothetical protein
MLMNGTVVENTLWEEKDGMIYIYDQKKNLFGNEKTKAIELNKSEIFSLSNGSKEQIMYYQDTMLGDYYTPEEMRVYLSGAGDARKNYKARHISAIGFALCGATGYLVGDGLEPNQYINSTETPDLTSVSAGISFPSSPINGDYFLRLDYLPNRLFRFDGARWVKIEDSVRTNLTPKATNNLTLRSSFSKNTNTFTDSQGDVHPERQSLSKALTPKADN